MDGDAIDDSRTGAAPAILTADRFSAVAPPGLGHPGSTFAHSMAWFRDRLHVGTSARSGEEHARILARDPLTGEWETVFESPTQAVEDGAPLAEAMAARVGRDTGSCSMAVFQGRSDPAPCLYVGTMSGQLLRSEDGRSFEPATGPEAGDETPMSFRGLTASNGLLFAVSGDRTGRDPAPRGIIHVTDDPASGRWAEACAPGFGDPANSGISAMATAHGHVYAGTGSPTHGFQLWRTRAEGPPPFHWEKVLANGAWRYNLNHSVVALIEFDGDLYVGSGLPGPGQDRENDLGPSAAELLRVHPDKSWDLLVGEPRFTPDGLKVPLSAMGPGYDDPHNAAASCFGVHEGVLYAGTDHREPFHWALHGGGAPIGGGCQLWATTDGETWTRIVENGHGRATSTAIRALCSTPDGLFVGTANHAKLIAWLAKTCSGVEMTGPDREEGFDLLLGR